MPETYIITPNLNGVSFLEVYFRSLLRQTYEDFRVVFIDNGSSDGSVDFIKSNFSEYLGDRIILIENHENLGFAASNNQGIRIALDDPQCRYVVCLNNDTEVLPDFIENLILAAGDDERVGSVQARMIWGQNRKLIDSAGLEYSLNGLGFNRGAYEPVENFNERARILGCCAGACLYRREALEDVEVDGEYFDEDFFAYYEDFDLALRLRSAGWDSLYAPDAIVYHYKGGTNPFVSDFTVYHNWRNYTWTFIKNMPVDLLLMCLPLFVLTEIIQVLLNIKRGKLIILRAKYDAYRGLGRVIRKRRALKRVPESEIKEYLTMRWSVKVPSLQEN
ncbi:glycosyltransferase family 2 protein [Methanothermobacter thermautotrophicus]|uniref:glycosyltransferase family 2 protein n=1 Tax=Methanothermobacter thermautotrophicus TaxID=145262 RepID=UPI0022B97BD0|nr:glycosyltransferase family 2 protein [Methanothermobacter thermautotrophicus]WBF08292.1 glycosyltransferase family 2 protein [Methanothermobacter thermautotrophicus]